MDVEIGTPVAHFRSALHFNDRQDWVLIFIVNVGGDLFTLLEYEGRSRGKVLEGTVSDGGGDFGDGFSGVLGEVVVKLVSHGIGENLGRW